MEFVVFVKFRGTVWYGSKSLKMFLSPSNISSRTWYQFFQRYSIIDPSDQQSLDLIETGFMRLPSVCLEDSESEAGRFEL